MNDDEYFDQPDDDTFQDEVKARERSGGDPFSLYLSTANADPRKKDQRILSQEDKFIVGMRNLYYRMKDEGIETVSLEDIKVMLEKTKQIPGLRFKNPTAYILGYIASQGGKTLEPEDINHVAEDILPQIDKTGGITKPDIVRYARYWFMFLSD